ncbi:MAG: hypothetical protein NC397_03625 [Clostridium sp.]|nr:hypothetical protein [Clostridium sp.]
MVLDEDIKCNLFVLIANKSKNNYDFEASIDLDEIGIVRNEENALTLKAWLTSQSNIIDVKYSGHCRLVVRVTSEFINNFSTEE